MATTKKNHNQEESVIELILKDHTEAKTLFDKIPTCDDNNKKASLRNQLVKTLLRHNQGEQLGVYPYLKEIGDTEEGEKEYHQSIQEHQEMRDNLFKLKQANVLEPQEFNKVLAQNKAETLAHMEYEESKTLPMLEKHFDGSKLKEIATEYLGYKDSATTRPHTDIPMEGSEALFANLALKPIDAMKDLIEERNLTQ